MRRTKKPLARDLHHFYVRLPPECRDKDVQKDLDWLLSGTFSKVMQPTKGLPLLECSAAPRLDTLFRCFQVYKQTLLG